MFACGNFTLDAQVETFTVASTTKLPPVSTYCVSTPINNPMELATQPRDRKRERERERERAGDLFVISLIKYTCGLTVCSPSIHCNYRRRMAREWEREEREAQREREREREAKDRERQPLKLWQAITRQVGQLLVKSAWWVSLACNEWTQETRSDLYLVQHLHLESFPLSL